MKSTQNNPNNNQKKEQKGSPWQMPDRANVYLTPGAQKSLEEAQRQGKQVRISSDRPERQRPAPPSQNGTPRMSQGEKKAPQKKPAPKKSEPLSLKDAVIAEIQDRIKAARLSIQLNSEDIVKGAVLGALLVLFAVLQTTFFVRFAPFGKVPDLMLTFVIAIGVYEGERWGCVFGLICAFVIQALGYSGITPEVLSLLYLPAGCASGLLSKYYLRHTAAVNATYIGIFSVIRSIITVLCAIFTVDAAIGVIILKIAIPELFSTLAASPLPFLITWLILKPFHKTRADRTDSRGEL